MTELSDLQGWLDYLEKLHPRKIDLGLERLTTVGRRLELLPLRVPVITVAGTNGKGTVVRCATALLVAAGKRVGTYTSPHLLRYNERICVDATPAADSLIIGAFEAIEAARGDISLSYFEFATLAALYIFRAQAVDIAVLEVGLGGRLDAVNAVDATVTVITRIALDHQQWLGDTLDSIAVEKAGIVRRGRPLVLAEQAYPATLYAVAKDRAARVQRAGAEWHWRRIGSDAIAVTLPDADVVESPVPVGLQPSNVAAAICAVAASGISIHAGLARRALADLVFPGRQQHVRCRGLEIILDVAHNPDAAQALAVHLASLPPLPTFAIVGVLGDKDVDGLLAPLLPHLRAVAVCTLPDTPRSLPARTLAGRMEAAGVSVLAEAESPQQAWNLLLPRLQRGSRLIVFGSFHTVGGIMPAVLDSSAQAAMGQTWTRH